MKTHKINNEIFWNYFAIALINSIYTSIMPLYYKYLGLNATQVGLLVSIVFLGAAVQPVFGILADKTQKPRQILIGLYSAIFVLAGSLFFVSNFYILFIIILLTSIARMPFFGLTDNLVLKYANENNQNYGALRVGGSIGWGLAMIIVIPFVVIINVNAFIAIIMLASLLSMRSIRKIPYTPLVDVKENHYLEDLKLIRKDKKVVALIGFQVLLMGTMGLKFSYQAIILQELSGNSLIPAIALLASTIPEIACMKYYKKLEDKIGVEIALALVVIVNLIQLILFATISNYYLLIIAAMLHGFGMAIFIPGFMVYLKANVNQRISSTIFVSASTLQSLYAWVISGVFLTPIYSNGGVERVYLALAMFVMMSFIPLFTVIQYKKKEKNA